MDDIGCEDQPASQPSSERTRRRCLDCSAVFNYLQTAAAGLKCEVVALYYASLDPATGCAPRTLVALALAYALSPIDLIPDFIPILGLLDDLVLLPCILWLAVKLIPTEVMVSARERARSEPLRLHKHQGAAFFIALIWLISLEGAAMAVMPLLPHSVHHFEHAIYIALAALFVLGVGIYMLYTRLRVRETELPDSSTAAAGSNPPGAVARPLQEPLLRSEDFV
eukprot:6192361-Pleurochrysis_carterae.AAC.2